MTMMGYKTNIVDKAKEDIKNIYNNDFNLKV